jgi:mono/diheme cytochrome c family protein
VIATALLVSALLLGHGKGDWTVPEEDKKRQNPVVIAETSLAAARDVYRERCLRCHGETGKGDGSDAGMYGVKAADFSDAHMMSEMTDGEIFYKLSEGRRPMPSFKKRLTAEQRWQLVHFLRTFAGKPGGR